MKALVPVLCTAIAAGPSYLALNTAVKRDADATRHELDLAVVAAERDELAGEVADLRAELAATTERRPKRVARGEVAQPPAPVTRTAEVQGALARATVAAKANPATAALPKEALTTRIVRGLTGVRR